jgi:hypothetical protein
MIIPASLTKWLYFQLHEANRNFLGCFIDEWMIGTIGTG